MPTGYTAELMKKGQTFQQFILGCARAFGALVMMRDDPHDAPILEAFEPSDWNVRELKKDQDKSSMLKAMSDDEKLAFGEAKKKEDIESKQGWIKDEEEQNNRLIEMEQQVNAWRPPTPDHQGLKDFMLQQIGTSKHDVGYYTKALDEAEQKSPMAYYVEALSNAQWGINYHTKNNEEEIQRTNSRNEWIKQLRDSI